MKVLVKDESLCIGCHTCEEVCAQLFFKTKDLGKACIHINTDKDRFHHIGICNQCGECINHCPVQAITRGANGVVRINKNICVGCMICVAECPEGAMSRHDELVEPFKCISCGACVKKCPTGAIKLKDIEVDKKEKAVF
jgi:ferredoxin